MEAERRLPIRSELDILTARQRCTEMARELGFAASDLTALVTAISEIARNIVQFAGRGEIAIGVVRNGPDRGIAVVASDEGPGIADVDRAMQEGFSTGRSLGLGLAGARRLMDEFELRSEVGKGTTVTMRKWIGAPSSATE
jgi:serine/threonine-protein kinase RsbT